MPKVTFVKKARRDYLTYGIKKGESYYWWKFRFGARHVSKTYPKPQELTQSDFLKSVYDIQEEVDKISGEDTDDLESQVSCITDEIRNLASEQEDKRSNMPDQLQDSGSGEMLQNRADSLNEWADELENVDLSIDTDEFLEEATEENEEETDPDTKKKLIEEAVEQKKQDKLEELISELTGCSYNGE